MTKTPQKVYDALIQSGEYKADPEQAKAVSSLTRLFDELIEIESAPKQSFFSRLTGGGKVETPLGVYMYGGGGRGKSMLMDL